MEKDSRCSPFETGMGSNRPFLLPKWMMLLIRKRFSSLTILKYHMDHPDILVIRHPNRTHLWVHDLSMCHIQPPFNLTKDQGRCKYGGLTCRDISPIFRSQLNMERLFDLFRCWSTLTTDDNMVGAERWKQHLLICERCDNEGKEGFQGCVSVF